jgi:hypothetical protein
MWKQSRHALDFFYNNGIKFWKMLNDNSRLPDGSSDYVLSSEDGSTLIVYRRSSSGVEVDMQGLSGSYSVQWYNPREGGSLQSGSMPRIIVGAGGGTSMTLFGVAPESNDSDWVVLLTKV